MSHSIDPTLRLALTRALRHPPSLHVRAITIETGESAADVYRLIAFHHGPAPRGLLQALRAMCAPVLNDARHGVARAQLTLQRIDRPESIVSRGLPLFARAGAAVVPPPSPSPVAAPPKATRTPVSLDD